MSQMFNSLKDRNIIMIFILSLSLDIMSRLLGSNYIHIYIYSLKFVPNIYWLFNDKDTSIMQIFNSIILPN